MEAQGLERPRHLFFHLLAHVLSKKFSRTQEYREFEGNQGTFIVVASVTVTIHPALSLPAVKVC